MPQSAKEEAGTTVFPIVRFGVKDIDELKKKISSSNKITTKQGISITLALRWMDSQECYTLVSDGVKRENEGSLLDRLRTLSLGDDVDLYDTVSTILTVQNDNCLILDEALFKELFPLFEMNDS